MLSTTYSIGDAKKRLRSTYSDLGFASATEYDDYLIIAFEDAMLNSILPKIGQDSYDEIAAKDRIDLTSEEKYIYNAEVLYACCNLMMTVATYVASSSSSSSSSQESLRVEGYDYETKTSSSSGTTTTPAEDAARKFEALAQKNLVYAGYNVSSFQRTCNVFGDSEDEDVYPTVTI